MTGIVDLHNHLLPGVDDGSRSMDESLKHLRLFFADGVRRVAVSPHLFGWLTEEEAGIDARLDVLEDVFEQLQARVAGETDIPQLFFSQEILCPTPEIARAVFSSKRPGVRDTSYALVEFGFDIRNIECVEIVHTVNACGRRAIISHPERYRHDRVPVSVAQIVSWKEAGAALQVNGGSLIGDYGEAVERTAWSLLSGGFADIISTDHHADYRQLSPADVADAIVARGGDELAQLLMCENTGRILEDADLLVVPPLRHAPE